MTYLKIIMTCCLVIAGTTAPAFAKEIEDRLGGSVEAEVEGKLIQFPALKTDVIADIKGDIANVKIIQIFENPTNVPLNARYLFPMNKDSAVHAMTMEIGDEIVRAKIKRKEEARETFEKAKKEGKTASLLTQHRPNMFTQKIANLMPGMPVTVTLEYVQSVPKKDGAYELVVPLIVGPRFNPAGMGEAPDVIDDPVRFGTWELENRVDYPEVNNLDLPKQIDAERVSIKVNLESAIDVQRVYSDTHKIITAGNDKKKTITLEKSRIVDNADFVLRYKLAGKDTQAGFLSERVAQGNFFSLMIEPPALPESNQITAREMVFVLDTSGSMDGLPIEASKTFMQYATKELRPTDSFRLICFNDTASEYTSVPLPATPDNVKEAMAFINELEAGGGTNIPLAISQAFAPEEKEDVLRIVVFLSDGYIGNEASVLKQMARAMGNARVYAFGVGSSVNRYLLSEMGHRGHGFARFIDPTEDMNDVAISLAKKLNAPVLTDIEIDWGTLKVSDVTPDIIPDLFAGDSIRVQGRFEGAGTRTIRVKGKVQGKMASLPLKISLTPSNDNEGRAAETGKAISLLWARSSMADLMRLFDTPYEVRSQKILDDDLKEAVVKLGLDFSLMTKWTSFVAVSEKVVNKTPEKTKEANVPLPMVKGVTQLAYANNFSGGSVPEPGTTGALIVLGGAGLSAIRKRKGRKGERKGKPV